MVDDREKIADIIIAPVLDSFAAHLAACTPSAGRLALTAFD